MLVTSQNFLKRIAELFLIGMLVNVTASTFGPCLLAHGYSFTLA